MAKRNTWNYSLYDGNKKVYIGISDDPSRRFQEHEQDKKFSRAQVDGRAVSRDTALEREQAAIERYQNSHNGRKPKYND
jgi:predicted GIY-YIG superfamily endonuclease